jgi:hypothetical protein
MEKNKIETLTAAADTVTAKSVAFEITIRPKNMLHGWMQKKGWMVKKKEFSIQPIVLGNLLRISRLLLTIDTDGLLGKITLDTLHKLISAHTDTVIQVLAIAIHNSRSDPSSSLIRLITDNITSEDAARLLRYVLSQMDLKNFMHSIISIRGLNVLESEENRKESSEVSPSTKGS